MELLCMGAYKLYTRESLRPRESTLKSCTPGLYEIHWSIGTISKGSVVKKGELLAFTPEPQRFNIAWTYKFSPDPPVVILPDLELSADQEIVKLQQELE